MLAIVAFAIVIIAGSQVTAGDDQQYTKAAVDCDLAAYRQYKADLDALYKKIGTRPITVEEVMTDRRLTEGYCLKQAACYGTSSSNLGQSFLGCLDTEAREEARQLDELMREQ